MRSKAHPFPKRTAAFCAVAAAIWLWPGAPAFAQSGAEEIGSLRNARIAMPVSDKKTELTYFAGSLSKEELAELAKLAPNLRIVTGLSAADALARAEEAHGVDARYATREFLAKAKNLVWVQAMSAGVERLLALEPLVKNDRIVLTNQRGAMARRSRSRHGDAAFTHPRSAISRGEPGEKGVGPRGIRAYANRT
jgi:hypothetical protein